MAGWTLYPRSALEVARVLATTRAWKAIPWQTQPGTSVSADFFGINVAGSPESGTNQYVMDRLSELGVRHVRMDLSAAGDDPWQRDLLQELLAKKFRVMLRLVQPMADAQRMNTPEGEAGWGAFLDEVSDDLPLDQLEAIEVGAVSNRKKWSGYSHAGYLRAWTIAHNRLGRDGLKLAGPNVSDFEPLHAMGLLSEMQRLGCPPEIHTNNLFVERVREPEAFDHRVLGERWTDRLQLNLIKKAGIFAALSNRYGAAQTMCTHTCWNIFRLRRWTDDVEALRAAYLERYLLLAAAGGSLDRVYWGPLIGHADGLIDDGTGVIAEGERVAHYPRCPGSVADYEIRPAFETFRSLVGRLTDTTFVRGDASPEGPFEFVFRNLSDSTEETFRWERDAARDRA